MLTTEQLLTPRYKVSEHGYPDMPFTPEQILTLNSHDDRGQPYWRSKKGNFWYAPFFDRFPSIFAKLEWWEGRKPEELPPYVKIRHQHKLKVVIVPLLEIEGEGPFSSFEDFLPATEAEYLAQNETGALSRLT